MRSRVRAQFSLDGEREKSQARQVYAVARQELCFQFLTQRLERAGQVAHRESRTPLNVAPHLLQGSRGIGRTKRLKWFFTGEFSTRRNEFVRYSHTVYGFKVRK